MEIDNTPPPTNDAPDRPLPTSPEITIAPIHADVAPDTPDSFELADERAKIGALPNASNDTEQTEPPAQHPLPQTQPEPPRSKWGTVGVATIAVVGLGLLATAAVLFVK